MEPKTIELGPREEISFRAICKGFGTFHEQDYPGGLQQILIDAYDECSERTKEWLRRQ